jgi:hypothetical protein
MKKEVNKEDSKLLLFTTKTKKKTLIRKAKKDGRRTPY